jgi:hypothetical protein
MPDMNLLIRTAGSTRKAEVTVADSQTFGDLIQAAITQWALPTDRDYTITNVSKTPPQTLNPSTQLAAVALSPGDTLEIQPILVAGLACE